MDVLAENITVHVNDGNTQRTLLTVPYFSLKQGERVAIYGPSGSGKTTFLSLLAGLRVPSQGKVLWKKERQLFDFTKLTQNARNIWRREHAGMIFQDLQLIPELTLMENVLLPLTFCQFFIRKAEKTRAEELLAAAGLENVKQKAASLSRGEKQRVAFCRAIFLSPSVIFADEPTASLDKENSAKLHSLLLNYTKTSGCSFVLISHDSACCESLERKIYLEKGVLSGSLT